MLSFRAGFGQLMAMRAIARRFGRELHCDRRLLDTHPIPGVSMRSAIGRLSSESERRAALVWLTRAGPFWDDMRKHGPAEWLEWNGEIVTDSAVGEAAFRSLHGVECGLASISPSNWTFSPVTVTWRREAEELNDRFSELENWWDQRSLHHALVNRAAPILSWNELRDVATSRFGHLTFARDCFAPLKGVPFSKSAADRFLFLLSILEQLAGALDSSGTRTEEGHQIYTDYFTGERALFSDSSESEKHDFRKEMTFIQPGQGGFRIFCPWHGKVSRMTLRLHFSWPMRPDKPVYIVYAGPKITKW